VFDINDELDYIIFPEGRILHNNGSYTFEYHLKDHLGSTRVAFTASPDPSKGGEIEVVQENSYYPFGAPISDLSWSPKSTNRYLREGKEYISDFDWNKYDFTGRTFDSWTLRALQVDPMAAGYYSVSPYALWLNNPLRVIDPTGMWTDEPQQGQTYDDLNFLQKMFYNIISLMNAQGKAVNEMHGKTETTGEENIMASIEYTTGAVLLLQAHTEMARSAGKVSSSNKNTSVVKEATIPESIAAPANAVKAESRVFWSGGDVAKNAAMDFAKSINGTTLEMTTKGKIMNTISPYLPRFISTPIWESLSINFAKEATKEVHFFTTPLGPRPNSIWINVEKPILDKNSVKILVH
jgi:RHS repeat-associated protein